MNKSTVSDTEPVRGPLGAAATAHPLATRAALRILEAGGTAVDACIGAQAVIAVVMPHAAGLGGDLLALVHRPDGGVRAVNGTGRSSAAAPARYLPDGGSSVTVPGMVDAWFVLHGQWGRLPLANVMADALGLARDGYVVDAALARAVQAQRARMEQYDGGGWPLLDTPVGGVWRQPELANLLAELADAGPDAFYAGPAAQAQVDAVARAGGALSLADLAGHQTEQPPAVGTPWDGGRLIVQPPSSQGILLAMAARWAESAARPAVGLDHQLVEATEAAFGHRSEAGTDAAGLLGLDLQVDLERAALRGGPRAYLHTAGVAVADAQGMVVSSLVSVFDDFGSAVVVPELGIVLNNRAAGFTDGSNAPGPGRRPVHTLAPALLIDRDGWPLALATPGADGQVQVLLQVLARMRYSRAGLGQAVLAPRWRSEGGVLLVEAGHPAASDLTERGHRLVERVPGDDVFGAVVAAGLDRGGPYAAGDWRRNVVKGAC